MRYWEFLIQQEGDQTWLPLETRQVEILEGRYRMAAHTSYDETSVDVRVSQLLLDEMPPRRRVRKRKSITNDSGLLAIFPYMQLSAGHWEIHCSSPDVIDDFLGEGWQYSVQLQVAPREDEDWDPSWESAATDSLSEPEEQSWPTESRDPSDSATSNTSPKVAPVDEKEPFTDTDTDQDLELELKQQAYVTQPGQSLNLVGDIIQSVAAPFKGQLWVELRDPQVASTLQEKGFDITKPSLPAPFAVTIFIPEELSTQVVLGAISVRNQAGATLASASFTVTVGLAQLLDAIANQPDLEFEEEISIFPGTTESLVPSLEKSATLLDDEIPLISKEIIPSEGLTLPPQLKPPGSSETERQLEPELPDFPKATPVEPVAAPVKPESDDLAPAAEPADDTDDGHPASEAEPPDRLDTSTQESLLAGIDRLLSDEQPPSREATRSTPQETPVIDAVDLTENSAKPSLLQEQSQSRPFAEPRVFERGSIEDDDLDRELVHAALNDQRPEPDLFTQQNQSFEEDLSEPSAPPPPDEIDLSFQQLRLQERFWEKLNLFTQDGYRQALEVKKALDAPQNISKAVSSANFQSDEFVVYDLPEPSTPLSDSSGDSHESDPVQIAAPVLDIPEQELIAGEWVAIRVRLPVTSRQVYVKVWMNDLQTRTVVESPRLLMQFTPNTNNELETLMRVKLPTGCLELQFAAIAIDMATLQESRKVTQNRRVMPPNESLSIFDDLNF